MTDILFIIIVFWQVILIGICTVGVFYYYLNVIAVILSSEFYSIWQLLLALIPYSLYVQYLIKEMKELIL